MFPDTHTEPSSVSQQSVGLPIPFDVPFELRPPIVAFDPRAGSVLWTAMPEAAVDKDCRQGVSEDEGGRPPHWFSVVAPQHDSESPWREDAYEALSPERSLASNWPA